MDLPEKVLGLSSEVLPPSPAELEVLPADTQISKRLYKGSPSEIVNCQVVLSGNDRRSIHRPEACLRGQGWTIKNGGTVPVELSDGTKMDVMKLVIDRPIETSSGEERILRSLYLYWFASKSALTPYHGERIARTYKDLLFRGETHRWAYIIVSAPVLRGFVSGGKDEEQTLEMLKEFIAEAVPQFQHITPDDPADSTTEPSPKVATH